MPSRSSATNVAAASGPPPSRSRRTSADPTITPSASVQTAAACSALDTPIPVSTGRSVLAQGGESVVGGRRRRQENGVDARVVGGTRPIAQLLEREIGHDGAGNAVGGQGPGEDHIERHVVGQCGEHGDVGGQGRCGQRLGVRTRVGEQLGDGLGVGAAAAVAEGEQPAAGGEALGHRVSTLKKLLPVELQHVGAQPGDLLGLVGGRPAHLGEHGVYVGHARVQERV